MLSSAILQAVLICGSTLFLWRLFRQLLVKSDLDNIPGLPSPSYLYGHVQQLRDKQGWAFYRELAEKYPAVARLSGPLGRKLLFVHDPKAMHYIAVKEQETFQEAEWFTSLTNRAFGPGLLATQGDHHRKQRKLLNPVFSINHMRHMMPTFYHVTHKLREAIEQRVVQGPTEVDMVMWMGRTALELVGQAGLGYSFDKLTEESADEFGEALKSMAPTMATLGVFLQFLPLVEALIPECLLEPLGKIAPIPGLRDIMHISKTLKQKSTEIFMQKKTALLQGDEALAMQVGEGKDIMSVLLRANMTAAVEDRLDERELIGQMSTITFAAMDTTSNALSITLWRLAQNQQVQDRVRQEIFAARDSQGGKDIPYDDLVSLPFLDAICRETLRVHVPAPMRFREARKDSVLPLSEPIRGLDGKLMHEIFVPKDTHVFVSINASNTNPAIWGPDAHEWKPERWLSPLPETVSNANMPGVYSNLMTFWAGGRACIGFKFSQLEMKVVLAVLLSTFKFELTEKAIYWNIAPIVYPSVVPDGSKPELPIKVTLLDRDVTEA
ncbi:cytochrome P450 [Dichomitus squalens]|uniref:Cytochrome P450 n=1 Tax=Dichomitus squalens TaxID=114155 RepID=A0A4Q9Q5F4_9APHY|nr:cytochrome P450 [Dichomitus squalens]TBU61844.1 cytochrome P450 [Dichomitus squalens]